MSWVAVAKVAVQVASGLMERKAQRDADRRDDERARQIIAALTNVVNEAKREIIGTIVDLRIRELEGELDGVNFAFAAYQPIEADKERIREVIDDSGSIVGQLGRLMERGGPETPLFREAYNLYIIAVFLRAHAMVERTVAFGESDGVNDIEDIPLMFQKAVVFVQSYLDRQRIESDWRFTCGTVIAEELDGGGFFAQLGYRFNGQFVVVETSTGAFTAEQRQRAMRKCEERKDTEYEIFPGVQQNREILDRLTRVIDDIDRSGETVRLLAGLFPALEEA